MVSALPPAPPAQVAPAPVTVRDLVELTRISSLAVSPDGRWVAFRTERASLTDDRLECSWYVAPVDGRGAARFVGAGGEALYSQPGGVETEPPLWSPGSDALYYRALIGGELQVWRAPVDGNGAVRLTADPANVRSIALGADGTTLSYSVDATRAAIEQAERDAFDEGTPGDGSADLAQPASRGGLFDGTFASRRSPPERFGSSHLLWQTPSHTVTIALPASDRATTAAPAAPPMLSWSPRWEAGSAHWRLVATPPGGVPVACTAQLCDERNPVAVTQLPGHDGYLVTLRDAVQSDMLGLWTPQDQIVRPIARADGLLTGGSSDDPCVGTADTLICVAEAATAPQRLVRIAVADGRVETLFAPNAELAGRITTTVRLITWRDHRGIAHSGRLLAPAGPRPAGGFPVAMTYYGCSGFLRGGTGNELPLIPLAEHGIAALCISAARFDYAHQDAVANQRQAREDIGTVLALLEQDGTIDRHRIGMWGFSFGAETMTQILMHTDWLAAAASATGLPDPGIYWFDVIPNRSAAEIFRTTWKLGSPDEDHKGWKDIAPALDIASVKAPLLLQMPEYEARQTIQAWSKLSTTRVPAEFWMFANEPHLKIFPRHTAVAMARNLDWFRYWLDQARDPDPAKQAQYARWDALAARWRAPSDSRQDRTGP